MSSARDICAESGCSEFAPLAGPSEDDGIGRERGRAASSPAKGDGDGRSLGGVRMGVPEMFGVRGVCGRT